MSYKRLQKELKETFDLNIWTAFVKFVEQKIYKLIAPQEFTLPEYNFSKLIAKLKPENVWIIYVGLLPEISNLPLTKNEAKIVESFRTISLNFDADDYEVYKTFKNIPIESAIMYSAKNPKLVEKYFTSLDSIELRINGNDIQNLGIAPSEKYQECFDYILKEKIKSPTMKLEDEISLARDFFGIN